MTKVKKMLGFVMAALMCFALTPAAAFAASGTNAGDNGSITINNAIDGESYTIYQVLELESYNEEAKAYSYKVSGDWLGFFQQPAQLELGFQVENGYLIWDSTKLKNDSSDLKVFAQEALNWAKNNSEIFHRTEVAESNSVTFSGLPLGYYVMSSTAGTLLSIDTNHPNAVVKEKNDVPTIEKSIVEDGNLVKDNDAAIGDIINFKSVITCQPGTIEYVFTDTMSKGLTLTGDVTITPPTGKKLNATSNTTVNEDGTTTIRIEFDNAEIAAIAGERSDAGDDTSDKEIVITYSAVLNADAVVGVAGNSNDVLLEYKTAPNTDNRKDEDQTKTYTWEFGVYKYTTENGNMKDLPGAEFELWTTSVNDAGERIDGQALKFSLSADEAGYNVYKVDSNGNVTVVSPGNGRIKFVGLDQGVYRLKETKAPDGYNKLASDKEVEISYVKAEDGKVTYDVTGTAKDNDTTLNVPTVQVENKTGIELPSTGGMGTTILYIVGGVLVVGAIVFLVTRRRSSAK